MDEQNIRSIIQDELQKYATRNQYGVSKIPYHTHNGTDASKIEEKNIIQNKKTSSFLQTTLVTGGTEVDTIVNVPNLSSISFLGFAANNAGGGAATKRAIINGLAEIGRCSLYADSTTGFIPATPISILQTSNSMYVDSTDLTKNRVTATNGDLTDSVYTGLFCYTIDDTGTELVRTVVTYTNSIVTFTTTIASGWKLQGALILK